jgi:pSer/pThr/pTyr-binding forkhead associated (FHA) protein
MPCLFVLQGPDEGTLKQLETSIDMTIGRSDEATFQLLDEKTSRVHCTVTSTREVAGDFGIEITKWVLADAGSSNGTQLGSRQLDEATTLCDGDVMGVGVTVIVYLEQEFNDARAAMNYCAERGINADTLSAAPIPMYNPSDSATLNDN